MLLLKFVGKDFTKYFKFDNIDHFNIKEEERIGLDINLDFDFIDNKWYVVNKSDEFLGTSGRRRTCLSDV